MTTVAKNDSKINEILETIKSKIEAMGEKPKAMWSTNGVLKLDGTVININTVTTIDGCVAVVANLLDKRDRYSAAAKILGVPYNAPSLGGYSIDSWIADFKVRASMILWDGEMFRLEALKSKSFNLISEDAKTAHAIEGILNELK